MSQLFIKDTAWFELMPTDTTLWLTCCHYVIYFCDEFIHHHLKQRLGFVSVPSNYLNQCWSIGNFTIGKSELVIFFHFEEHAQCQTFGRASVGCHLTIWNDCVTAYELETYGCIMGTVPLAPGHQYPQCRQSHYIGTVSCQNIKICSEQHYKK